MNVINVEKRNLQEMKVLIRKYSMDVVADLNAYSSILIDPQNNRFRLLGIINNTRTTIYNLSIKDIKKGLVEPEIAQKDLKKFVLLFRQLQNIQILRDLENDLVKEL